MARQFQDALPQRQQEFAGDRPENRVLDEAQNGIKRLPCISRNQSLN
jgi:hypothetical protein